MPHPLEPLSAAEVSRAVTLLAAAGKLTPATRVVCVMLKEPP
jgi:primary-amine oxidase